MSYTLDQLSTMMDALTVRVTALDGQGLGSGVHGSVPQLQALVNGQKIAVQQLTATLQGQLVSLKTSFNSLLAPLRQALGLQP